MGEMTKPRVVLGDDHSLVIAGFQKLLEDAVEIVGTASDGRELVRMAQNLAPDLILMDISMPVLNGLQAARTLRRTLPQAKMIFVTMHDEPEFVAEAFRSGASGYLLKRCASSDFHQAAKSWRGGVILRRWLPQSCPPSRRK
jgi:DNA-binding NarL/FixJ family response regulator